MAKHLLCSLEPLSAQDRFAVLRLDRPAKLNAFTPSMMEEIEGQIQAWEKNPHVRFIWLESTHPTVFCSGGDLLSYYPLLCDQDYETVFTMLKRVYAIIYRLYLLQTPIVSFSHGLTLGGGSGLQQSASLRLITPRFTFGMPEVAIGYCPDCGVGHTLAHCQDQFGFLLGVSGTSVNARDALDLSLADICLHEEGKAQLWQNMQCVPWPKTRQGVLRQLTTLASQEKCNALPPSRISEARAVMRDLTLSSWEHVLQSVTHHTESSPWLQQAYSTMRYADPLAMQATHALFLKARSLSFQQYREHEFKACQKQITSGALCEGIRALLVDRDRQPQWPG